jgi:hypothetical protein
VTQMTVSSKTRKTVQSFKNPFCQSRTIINIITIMNDNQNYFVQAGRTTSRVRAQPGGSCSISIGGWTQEELSRNKKVIESKWMNRTCDFKAASVSLTYRPASRLITAVIQEESEPEKQEEESQVEKENVVETKNMGESKAPAEVSVKPSDPAPQPKKIVSSNAFASASTSNSFNVVTDRTTSRVKMPPGGHSSIRLW